MTAGGRIYYKESRRAPGGSQWHLVARDAYNGFELWRAMSGPIWHKTTYTDFTLTCDEERVYLVEGRTLLARDGKTGETVWEHKNPSPHTPLMDQFGPGPHTTPTISGDHLFTIGTNAGPIAGPIDGGQAA